MNQEIKVMNPVIGLKFFQFLRNFDAQIFENTRISLCNQMQNAVKIKD